MLKNTEISSFGVSLASAEQILSWSHGKVDNPLGFNLFTGKPELGGLFCSRIFGPVRERECLCDSPPYGVSSCPTCGVEFVSSWFRRKRFGHIELAVPVVHTWCYKLSPNILATLLNLPTHIVNMIVNYELHLVVASEEPEIKAGEYIATKAACEMKIAKVRCKVLSGANMVLELLNKISVRDVKNELCAKLIKLRSETAIEALKRKIELLESFIRAPTDPKLIVIKMLPVLPPGLRPAMMLKDDRYASSDLNELYRRVLIKNKAVSAKADDPEIYIRDMYELQQSVDALFDNSKVLPQAVSYNSCALKSLTDNLKGKNGMFRQNLLGKRVDYSGRSVIAPGPELKLNECGLPKEMAMELFKPFVQAKAMIKWKVNKASQADALLKDMPEQADELLDEATRWHPVLLNRAPTLHKLSFQAFRVRTLTSKVIRLHPLVCAGFNADFDGDQMAVHVPLTIRARAEAVTLMMSTKNVLHPAHGSPSILPTQDVILGLYYVSLISSDKSTMCFSTYADVSAALESHLIKLHTKVRFRTLVNGVYILQESTAGRILFNELLPVECEKFYNTSCPFLTKSYIYSLVDEVRHKCGVRRMTRFCVDIMKLGFKYACLSGISLGKSDFPNFVYKTNVLATTSKAVSDLSSRYRVSDRWELWANAVDLITYGLDIELAQTRDQTSIQIITNSGARGTQSQIRQLVGLKGFVYGFDGKLCLMPVLSSYTEGLSAIEFFFTTFASRKALADTALKTASSGYLTRKLVEAARDCIVRKLDCRTTQSVWVDLKRDENFIKHNLISRTLAKPVMSGSKVVLKANTVISIYNVSEVLKHAKKRVYLRSPITCECVNGVCSFCYGADLGTSKLVNLGQAVGVIAAQSIGEPGTQLTLRAFHDTGVARKKERVTRAHVVSPCDGVAWLRNLVCVFGDAGDVIVMGRKCTLEIERNGLICYRHKLRRGDRLLIASGAAVCSNSLLCLSRGTYRTQMLLISGVLGLHKLVEGASTRAHIDQYMGLLTRTSYTNSIFDAEVWISSNTSRFVYKPLNDEQLIAISGINVNVGDGLTWILMRVRADARAPQLQLNFVKLASLFESRTHARNRMLIAPFNCRLRLGQVIGGNRFYALQPLIRGRQPLFFFVRGKLLKIADNELIRRGKVLIPGELDLYKFVNQNNLNALTRYFVARIQEIYDSQGVNISSKHIEVVLSQMTRYAKIVSPGDSSFKLHQRVLWTSIIDINRKLAAARFEIIRAKRLIVGITRLCSTQQSLLSAMAYQGSMSLLIKAAISRARFDLPSIKERVMFGALAPVGTGIYRNIKVKL
ncbi:DNA-directed RNA polymerase subunit beta' [Candidatus Hodgkinia cicadicola]|nr:DNA-directed RNA polymerase subunit beta' [Candidatus Hodgkinia cicadicola]